MNLEEYSLVHLGFRDYDDVLERMTGADHKRFLLVYNHLNDVLVVNMYNNSDAERENMARKGIRILRKLLGRYGIDGPQLYDESLMEKGRERMKNIERGYDPDATVEDVIMRKIEEYGIDPHSPYGQELLEKEMEKVLKLVEMKKKND